MQVVGLITCERIVLGKGAKVLISESAQGTCPPTSWKKKVKSRRNEKEDERDGQQRVEGRVVENQNNHIISA